MVNMKVGDPAWRLKPGEKTLHVMSHEHIPYPLLNSSVYHVLSGCEGPWRRLSVTVGWGTGLGTLAGLYTPEPF